MNQYARKEPVVNPYEPDFGAYLPESVVLQWTGMPEGTPSALSRILDDFMRRFRLSKTEAGKVLGISRTQFRSYLEGVNVRTGEKARRPPRNATLLQLAAKMSEFGYPVTFQELKDAASVKVPEPGPLTLDGIKNQIVPLVGPVRLAEALDDLSDKEREDVLRYAEFLRSLRQQTGQDPRNSMSKGGP